VRRGTVPPVEACPRCGEGRGSGERWCRACGLDFTPTVAGLPTPEALAAADRERSYFEAHPELVPEQEARAEAAEKERERQELARLGKLRPASFDEYRDLSWPARLTRGWLVVVAGLTALTGVLEITHLNLLAGKSTTTLDLAQAQRIDDSNASVDTAYLVTLCAIVLAAVFFVIWTFRAYKNTTALGAQRPRFAAGWAIGGWFVPILGLYRPKEIVNDLWRGSDPGDPPVVKDWRGRKVPAFVTIWWAAFLLSGVADRISARTPNDTVEHQRAATAWGLTASVLTVIAACLAVAVVTQLTSRLRRRAAKIEQLPAD
jgi:Domain of unknown function (DUF4328)